LSVIVEEALFFVPGHCISLFKQRARRARCHDSRLMMRLTKPLLRWTSL